MKSIFLKLSTIILLFTFLIGAGCKKEKIDNDPDSIIGKWEWLYTIYGGYSDPPGEDPKEGERVTWEFDVDSIITVRTNNEITDQIFFYLIEDTLHIKGGAQMKFIVDIVQDTLYLSEHNVQLLPFRSFYKRIK